MRRIGPIETWVVYRNNHKALPSNAMCTHSEWEQLELKEPGVHALIRAGIENEGEAEKLARGTSGDPMPRVTGPKHRSLFGGRRLPQAIVNTDQELAGIRPDDSANRIGRGFVELRAEGAPCGSEPVTGTPAETEPAAGHPPLRLSGQMILDEGTTQP